MERKKASSGFKMKSPMKTLLGRLLMGRKKQVTADGTKVITDRKGKVVKTKTADGTKTKYKKNNRPSSVNNSVNNIDPQAEYNKRRDIRREKRYS